MLRLTPKSGPSARLFFDAQTFLIVRSVSKVMTAAAGEVEQVNESSDYRSVDGVKVAFTINQAAGGQFVTIKFDKVENNVPIDDGVFIKK